MIYTKFCGLIDPWWFHAMWGHCQDKLIDCLCTIRLRLAFFLLFSTINCLFANNIHGFILNLANSELIQSNEKNFQSFNSPQNLFASPKFMPKFFSTIFAVWSQIIETQVFLRVVIVITVESREGDLWYLFPLFVVFVIVYTFLSNMFQYSLHRCHTPTKEPREEGLLDARWVSDW